MHSFQQLQKLLKDKTRSLEDEIHSRRRAEEEIESLKRKVESLTKVENPAEQKLVKECEELRVRMVLFVHDNDLYFLQFTCE